MTRNTCITLFWREHFSYFGKCNHIKHPKFENCGKPQQKIESCKDIFRLWNTLIVFFYIIFNMGPERLGYGLIEVGTTGVLDRIILSFRKPFLSFYIYLLLIWLFMFIFIFLCCFLEILNDRIIRSTGVLDELPAKVPKQQLACYIINDKF